MNTLCNNVRSGTKTVWYDNRGKEYDSEKAACKANIRLKIAELELLFQERLKKLFNLTDLNVGKFLTEDECEKYVRAQLHNVELDDGGVYDRLIEELNIDIFENVYKSIVDYFLSNLDTDVENTLKLLQECLLLKKEIKTLKNRLSY